MRHVALVIAALVWFATPAAAQSGTIKDDYVGCLTKELLDEVLYAAARNEITRINNLLRSGCFNMRGWDFAVEKRGFLKSTVRVNRAGTSFVLWTINDAFR